MIVNFVKFKKHGGRHFSCNQKGEASSIHINHQHQVFLHFVSNGTQFSHGNTTYPNKNKRRRKNRNERKNKDSIIKKYVDFFKIDINDILIISDDLDQEVGKYKLKQKGSSGGHNGLKNIELHLKTQEYKRLKIGISNNKLIDTKDYVLGKISKEETDILDKILDVVPDIFNDYLKLSFNDLMNKYNKKK